ncbi:DUF3783 domain-containing protein [Peptoniphilus sp.]|jgi:hypothetical protein|uniref:DUF3783 domain-containing protein n=1 Tax=Peptoniphilus sp. TaxID=1971214 RepID=UPI003D8A0073
MEKVLAYGLTSERSEILKDTAKNYGIDVGLLSDENLEDKVGDLFLKEESGETKGRSEFLIFSDFDRNKLREFLLELKKNGVLVNHKCVLTETNKDWTLGYLMGHIEDEHRMVTKFRTIGGYVQVAEKSLEERENVKLRSIVEEAHKLKTMELDEELLDKTIAEFQKFFKL